MMEQWMLTYGEYLLPLLVLSGIVFLLIRQFLFNRAPEYTAAAVVESHQTEPGRFHSRWSSGWNYFVTFRLRDGDTITLYTTQQDFMELKDGMAVTIRWQHENLLSYHI